MLKDLLMLIILVVAIIMSYIELRDFLSRRSSILSVIGLVLLFIVDILIIFS